MKNMYPARHFLIENDSKIVARSSPALAMDPCVSFGNVPGGGGHLETLCPPHLRLPDVACILSDTQQR